MMRLFVAMLVSIMFAVGNAWGLKLPTIGVHVEKHKHRSCEKGLPTVTLENIVSTYSGVGEIDAFIVLFDFTEIKGISFGLTWPEAWGGGKWHDCSYLKIGEISNPGDEISMVWKDCIPDTSAIILGWVTLTVTSPGRIEIIPHHIEGTVAIGDCNKIAPRTHEAILRLGAGAGGAKGDSPSVMKHLANRRWHVKADSSGDLPTLQEALRKALPGDTILVAEGTYREHVLLRPGVVVMGSWSDDFRSRSLKRTPSVIQPTKGHSAVRGNLGEDSTAVLDGFVIRGANARFGAGIALRNGSSPKLTNLIIDSNTASYGGGIACHASSPVIRNVIFVNNSAETGGGIHCMEGSSPWISNVTFYGNKATYGGAIFAKVGSCPFIEKSVIANTLEGSAIYCSDVSSKAILACSLLWKNLPGNYGGDAEQAITLKHVYEEDPQFADPAKGDFSFPKDSPLATHSCGRMGMVFSD